MHHCVMPYNLSLNFDPRLKAGLMGLSTTASTVLVGVFVFIRHRGDKISGRDKQLTLGQSELVHQFTVYR